MTPKRRSDFLLIFIVNCALTAKKQVIVYGYALYF